MDKPVIEKVTKQVLDKDDFMAMLGCSECTAYNKIKEIKAVSDIWRISGKVSIEDYNYYIEQRKGKVNAK